MSDRVLVWLVRILLVLAVFILAVIVYIGLCIKAPTDEEKYNIYGRLIVPSLNINTAVSSQTDGDSAQKIIDQEDLAVYITWKGKDVIADHETQSFLDLPKAVPKKTIAYIYRDDKVFKYICTDVGVATLVFNKKNSTCDIISNNLKSFLAGDNNDLCMYTCKGAINKNASHVTMTFWQLIDQKPIIN